jgi:hypothetical protein
VGKSTQLSFEYAEDGEHDTGKGPIIKRGRQLTRNLFTKATFRRAIGSVVNADCRRIISVAETSAAASPNKCRIQSSAKTILRMAERWDRLARRKAQIEAAKKADGDD